MREAGDRYGLMVISEVMEISQIELMLPYIDIFQVGARNMQNFNLLRELGKVRKPVLLKRGIAATIEELLLSAEYIMSGGNYQVILCERGIRTFETYTRNTLDISAIPIVHKLSHLPITSDPSHGTGLRDKVAPMACASVAAGADALLIEVHPSPDKALSDGAQSLFPQQFVRTDGPVAHDRSGGGKDDRITGNLFHGDSADHDRRNGPDWRLARTRASPGTDSREPIVGCDKRPVLETASNARRHRSGRSRSRDAAHRRQRCHRSSPRQLAAFCRNWRLLRRSCRRTR